MIRGSHYLHLSPGGIWNWKWLRTRRLPSWWATAPPLHSLRILLPLLGKWLAEYTKQPWNDVRQSFLKTGVGLKNKLRSGLISVTCKSILGIPYCSTSEGKYIGKTNRKKHRKNYAEDKVFNCVLFCFAWSGFPSCGQASLKLTIQMRMTLNSSFYSLYFPHSLI